MEFNLYTISRKSIFSRTYDIYYGEAIAYRAKIHFFFQGCTFSTMTGEEIFRIKREFSPFKMRYRIEYQGVVYARVAVKGILQTKLMVQSEDADYLVQGKSFHRDFTIIKNDIEIAKVSRKNIFKTAIGVAIQEEEDDELILTLVMLIEVIIKSKRSKSGW